MAAGAVPLRDDGGGVTDDSFGTLTCCRITRSLFSVIHFFATVVATQRVRSGVAVRSRNCLQKIRCPAADSSCQVRQLLLMQLCRRALLVVVLALFVDKVQQHVPEVH